MTNPLAAYIRTPKLYVKLPSRGVFYKPGMIDSAVNGEVAVYPLSAIDQIMLKTPDALLNGETLLKIVKNCVPGVQDVKSLVEPDINTLLLAIKVASSNSTSEVEIACPSCQKTNSFTIDLSHILDTQTFVDTNNSLDFDDSLVIHLRPYNFEQRNLQMLNEIEEAQTARLLNGNEELSEAAKITEIGRNVSKMAERTFEVVARSISQIDISVTGDSVTDTGYIAEFLKGISGEQADIIIDKIRELNRVGIKTDTDFVCDGCEHTWTQPLDFDPTSFFG